ncbi:T cell receptor alpha chain MC.7.G5-like [Heliangelus exortis]|uniref:T cell receptor alpha chain MC.7.G5-like n=1 Tax=Heliangelus exortis TaxID=472823 RepID=UPI003A9535B0
MRQCWGEDLAGLIMALLVAVGRAEVQQEPQAETTEGTAISIHCSHPNLQSFEYIYWYRQFPGHGPAFIARGHKGSEELSAPPGRLSVAADRRSSALWLSGPRREDAAVYYCAVRDTGRGIGAAAAQEPRRAGPGGQLQDNSQSKSYLSLRDLHLQDSACYHCAVLYHLHSDRLVFGTGTQLTVEPKMQRSSDPEVIMIKSKKLKEDGSTGKAACLARNIYTKNIVLEMSSDEVLYEQNRSILTSESLYNTIKVVSVKNNMDVTCVAKFDGSTLTANTTLPEQKAEEPVSVKVCSTTGNSAQDPEVEKTNMLAMAVLCLRILMAKSIAFNTLMSVKLFLF